MSTESVNPRTTPATTKSAADLVREVAKDCATFVTAQAKDRATFVTAQAKQTAAHSTQVAREKTRVAREKLPPTVREKKSVPLAAAGAATLLAALLGWMIRRRRT